MAACGARGGAGGRLEQVYDDKTGLIKTRMVPCRACGASGQRK